MAKGGGPSHRSCVQQCNFSNRYMVVGQLGFVMKVVRHWAWAGQKSVDAGVKISSGGGWEEAVCRGTCGTEDYSDSVLIDEGCF